MLKFIAELRNRIIKSIYCLGVIFTIVMIFNEQVLSYIVKPILFKNLSATLIATSLPATILVPVKMSFYLSIILGLPFILAQIWLFVSPALFSHERKAIRPVIISSFVLLILGIGFALWVMYPVTVKFLIEFAPANISIMADISSLLDLILGMCLGAGLAFQVPLVTYILIALGICSKAQLRTLRPYVIISSLVLGMLLTPPDVISQIMLAVPMWLLFEMGLFFSRDMQHEGNRSIIQQ